MGIEDLSEIKSLVIFQKDNNLDKKDNLDTLPELPAVYAICGRVNNQAVNPRYVGESENLRVTIQQHFDKSGFSEDECCREFMFSIKTKVLVYELMPSSSKEERLVRKNEWELKYKPVCNKELNEIH